MYSSVSYSSISSVKQQWTQSHPQLDDFPHCEYVTPKTIPQCINPSDLRLAFFNCKGFLSSAEYMSPVIPDSGVDVFGASENFLTETTEALVLANLQGYARVSKTRVIKKQGGLAIFIKNNISHKVLSEYDYLHEEMVFEFLVAEADLCGESTVFIVE
ncbi:hypothetical protein QYM36_012791 [Artemia franciscana]|uniref:Uncharacterized protein n=1 Tax=Artemia franciscana TaxID=6661 RepID=A0AA88HQ45_ARTSF|nr:hypothetical protein QYM36_012791 [Artemia franciscana]